jgi:hypothetical protein
LYRRWALHFLIFAHYLKEIFFGFAVKKIYLILKQDLSASIQKTNPVTNGLNPCLYNETMAVDRWPLADL